MTQQVALLQAVTSNGLPTSAYGYSTLGCMYINKVTGLKSSDFYISQNISKEYRKERESQE